MLNPIVRLAILLAIAFFLPWLLIAYALFAAIDLGAMRTLDLAKVRDYFTGRDGPIWELAPLNIAADLLSGGRPRTIAFEDLAEECREEITRVTRGFDHADFLDRLAPKIGDKPKAMIFFKWYGRNIDSFAALPLFHREYRYIKTIGVSVFNRRSSIGRHFGPLRLTHRVLFNLNPRHSDQIYIEIDGDKHFWHDNPMLIFDDTYVHQSINESDGPRAMLFIDVIRPTRFELAHRALEAGVWMVNRLVFHLRQGFYGPWVFIK